MVNPETWDAARVEVEAALATFAAYSAGNRGLGKTYAFEEIIGILSSHGIIDTEGDW